MNIQKYKVENISFSAQYKHITGYPRHRENRENGKKFPVRENREFGNFAKTQGILL